MTFWFLCGLSATLLIFCFWATSTHFHPPTCDLLIYFYFKFQWLEYLYEVSGDGFKFQLTGEIIMGGAWGYFFFNQNFILPNSLYVIINIYKLYSLVAHRTYAILYDYVKIINATNNIKYISQKYIYKLLQY